MKSKMALHFIIAAIAVTLFTGCQNDHQSEGTLVKITNGTEFPKELSGTWRCEENKWEIILEEDGTVSWIRYPMGFVWMEPWKTTEVSMKLDRTSVYAASEVKAVYDLETQVFSIDIVVPFFEVAMGNDTLTGNSTDIFTGPMDTKEGLWEVEWFSMPTYIVNTSGLKDHQLEDVNDNPNKGKVVFKRYHIEY